MGRLSFVLAAFAAVLLVLAPRSGAQEASGDGDPLIGLWSYSTDYGPEVGGEMRITRSSGGWTASLAGQQAAGRVDGGEIRFDFGKAGAFRGRTEHGGREVRGFWLQPAGVTGDQRDPGGAGQAFATPFQLKRAGDNSWQGTVEPLDNRFTLYLSIFRGPDGTLLAAFRNPDFNSNGGASQFSVRRDGSAVHFSFPRESGDIRHEAMLIGNPRRLRMQWPDLGRAIELTRLDPARAGGFFPRIPGAPAYAYAAPPELGDGWRTARAQDLGVDETALATIVGDIAGSDPGARPPRLMHSILVAYRGRLILEEYFYGYDREMPHDMRSAGKTFASVMLGAARMRGTRISPETRAFSLLGSRGPFANPDPRKETITLAHLMTHSAGLACNDNDENSPGNEDTMQTQAAQPDWWKYTLDLPMAHDPGRRYAYCSANINLVGAALTTATRTWLPEYFDRTVARPLQFGRYHWNLMPTAEGYLGGGAFLRPRDFLKVGQAYLDGGVWNGSRIVPRGWVAASTAPRMEISEATTGYSAEEFGNYYGHGTDALAWHLTSLTSGGRTIKGYAATGNGGQVLIAVPELDLAVVFTGGNYGQGGVWSRWGQEFVGNRITPALGR